MTNEQKTRRLDALSHRQLRLVSSPIVQHKLTFLRDERTGTKEFRELVIEIGNSLVSAALEDAKSEMIKIKTPLAEIESPVINGDHYAFAPIIRAGEGMLPGALQVIPNARVVHIGMYRDEVTKEPHLYFFKAPKDIAQRETIILDPMLATGNSANAAISELKKRGVTKMKLVCIIAAPEGLLAVTNSNPEVPIYTAAVDWYLNADAFIVPGLGDAGDRIFGTK